MADVYTVTLVLIGMLLSLPGLLVALNLLLPTLTRRVQTRLAETPGRSFFFGLPITAVLIIFALLLWQAGFGPLKALGWLIALGGMGLGTLGASGLARLLGERLASLSDPRSELTQLVRGAAVYEFACLFPLVGWFLFAPLVGITVIGAAAFALLGWLPRRTPSAPLLPITSNP